MSRKHWQEGESGGAIDAPSGRGPLAWFPRLGMKLLAFAADAGYGGGTEAAQCPTGFTGGGSVGDMKCCGLAVPNNECCYPTGGKKFDYICPAGYNKTFWFCTMGTSTYGCGECSKGVTCYSGPWVCSIWWQVC